MVRPDVGEQAQATGRGCVPTSRLEFTGGPQLLRYGTLATVGFLIGTLFGTSMCPQSVSPVFAYKILPKCPCCGREWPSYGLSTGHIRGNCTGPIRGLVLKFY